MQMSWLKIHFMQNFIQIFMQMSCHRKRRKMVKMAKFLNFADFFDESGRFYANELA